MFYSTMKRGMVWIEPFLLFSVLFLPGFIGQSADFDGSIFNSLSFNINTTLLTLPQIGMVYYFIWIKPEPASRFGLIPFHPAVIIISLIVFMGVYIILLPLSYLLELLLNNSLESLNPVHWNITKPAMLPIIFITCLVTGYREEIFFRSYLLTVFQDSGTPRWLSIGLAALLFSAGHVYQGISGFLVALTIGIYFSLWFFKRRNLHILAIAHGLYNFFILLLTIN